MKFFLFMLIILSGLFLINDSNQTNWLEIFSDEVNINQNMAYASSNSTSGWIPHIHDEIEVTVEASMETRGYEGKAPVVSMDIGAAVSKHVAAGHIEVVKDKKAESSSSTFIVLAAVGLGLVIMFFK